MPEDIASFQVIISGRVQEVFFRASMKHIDEEHNVVGWVRNLSDGYVESLVQGKKSDVDKILEWCRSGPPDARVEEISVILKPSQPLRNFSILY